MTPIVNAVASAVRNRGGFVAWVLSRMTAMPTHFAAILGIDLATKYFNDGQPNGPGTRRDAIELGYKVIIISDALAGHAHGLHEATLATFYRIFGDVRPSSEIMELLSESLAAKGVKNPLCVAQGSGASDPSARKTRAPEQP